MFYVIHLLLGMIIGAEFNSPVLIAVLALLSHFILDAIPHWDGFFDKDHFEQTHIVTIYKTDVIIHFVDIILVIVLTIFIYYLNARDGFVFSRANMILGGFMAILPDLLKIGYVTKFRKKRTYVRYLKFHSKIQRDTNWKIGLLIQGLFFIIFLLVLIYII